MFWLSPRLALLSLAVVPVLLVVVRLFRRLLRGAHRLIRRRIAQINATTQEHITGMSVVQSSAARRARFRTSTASTGTTATPIAPPSAGTPCSTRWWSC